ncbi:hypothetical protein P4B35_10640 [Pontiellaceae bacterium B12227]|nr:hypothetical protein [Pontiellaceae bacterium B12227]
MVEMLLAMLSVSILLMLIGSLLVLGHRSWIEGNQRVALQRDATLAIEAIGNLARAAISEAPTVSEDNRILYFGSGTNIAWQGSQLVMNPGGTILVREDVLSFQARIRDELPSKPIHVILQLFDADSGESSVMTGTFMPRNPPVETE